MTGFALKKLLSACLMPPVLGLGMALLGLLLLLARRAPKTARALLGVGVLGTTLLSLDVVADGLLRPLEDRYPPLADVTPHAGVRWVVVLGGVCDAARGELATSRLGDESVHRVAEGVRLCRVLPHARLVVTGGAPDGLTPEAVIMAQLAVDLGMPADRLLVEPLARDTHDHGLYLRDRIGAEPFVLVTSAAHMPRSVALFRRRGMTQPIPAPTAYLARRGPSLDNVRRFLPSGGALYKSDRAAHEYLGLAWAWLRGQI